MIFPSKALDTVSWFVCRYSVLYLSTYNGRTTLHIHSIENTKLSIPARSLRRQRTGLDHGLSSREGCATVVEGIVRHKVPTNRLVNKYPQRAGDSTGYLNDCLQIPSRPFVGLVCESE